MAIAPKREFIIQSPFLYLQAAGSDFSDFTARGIHLRWQLRKLLGDYHLPKGNLAASGGPYPATIGFNQPNDFVHIYKAPYEFRCHIKLDLAKNPSAVTESGTIRKWDYIGLMAQGAQTPSDVEVRFPDRVEYDRVRASNNPMINALKFIIEYGGIIEIQVKNQLMFEVCFFGRSQEPSIVQAEAISVPDLTSTDERYIACRKKLYLSDIKTSALPGESEQANCMLCENIEYVRYRITDTPVTLLQLVTYQNTYEGYQLKQMWQPVDRFSLTLDKNEAFTRLDHPVSNETKVDNQWMKYNDLDLSTGMFTVSVNNYEDRWLPAQGTNGIRYAAEKYLNLSRTDLLATEFLPSETPGDDAVTELSYLNVLNILGVDYHVARMLGLGHLDLMKEHHYQPYIYFAAYTTQVALGVGYPAKARTHIALSLPTTQHDFRYPLMPELKPVTYGAVSKNGTQTPTPLTLPGGYTPDGLSRIINLFAQPSPFNHPMESFFRTQDEFCLCHASRTVLYGLDYKKDTELIWRQPELLHDYFYNDPAGLPETIPIPVQEDDTLPVFIHSESEEGTHEYALYAINWFSRVSPLGNIVPTDVTAFSRAPLPPLNLMSQFIQEENPLIFTTGPEQQLLQTLPAADNSLARVTFEWNQVHQDAYQFADFAELYIRKSEPVMVKGKITVVQNLSGNRALIHTGPYNLNSTNPVQTVQPFILPAQAASFAGGLLAAGQKLYQVLSVTVAGANPRFIVQQLQERTAFEDPAEPGSYIMNEVWTSPAVNEQFSITQNLSETTIWDAQLDKKVFLEKFFPLQVFGSSQAANNRLYTVQRVEHAGLHSEITVKETIPAPAAATPGQFMFKKFIKYFNTTHSQQTIAIENNLLGEFSLGQQVELIAAGGNSGTYTISQVSYFNHFTRLRFAQPLPDTNTVAGVVRFSVTLSISAYNGPSRKFIINNTHLKKSLVPAYREFVSIDEGQNVHEFVIGGIDDTATIVNLPDQVTGLPSGVFEVTLDHFILTPPSDTVVYWYKGSARIKENASLFPAPGNSNYRPPAVKTLQILSIDMSGAKTKIIVSDATFDPASTFANPLTDYMPIASGAAIRVNIHPGYRVYLTKANANISGSKPFRKADLLPAAGEGMRKSFIAIRAADLVQNKFSALSPPSVLLAQEIVTPEPPGIPAGPLFATRPDVYGKATYTFDVVINTAGGRQPYSLVFYRADIRKILDTLYKPAIVTQILQQLENLPAADKVFFNSRFHDLANTLYDNVAQQYRAYVPGGYRFPVPDNDMYVIPNPNPAIKQKPFNGIRTFGNSFMVTLYLQGDGTPVTENRPMYEIIKDAVDGAFLALTEQPVIYKYLKTSRTTSNAKPKIKNSNGELIVPGNPINFSVFDPYPMAVQFVDAGQTKVRFTDYALDGAAGTYYFYYGVELSNRLVVSDRSAVAGPISLVNSMPAEAPGIKRVVSTPQNLLAGLQVTVHFELNDFINSENIKKIRVYRANNKPDATTVRTMTLAAEIPVGAPVKDVFTGMAFPPYGEPLFYRLVALREIVNEQGQPEWVPSKPSEIVLTNIIDEANPAAPRLTYTSDPMVLPLTQLTNVSIQWQKTVHNGFYMLYKLGETGNWIQVTEVTDNAEVMNVSLATVLGSGTLIKQNDAGDTVFHHFKVVAVNSSGIKSREDRILTL